MIAFQCKVCHSFPAKVAGNSCHQYVLQSTASRHTRTIVRETFSFALTSSRLSRLAPPNGVGILAEVVAAHCCGHTRIRRLAGFRAGFATFKVTTGQVAQW
jgi:hypothetical protein